MLTFVSLIYLITATISIGLLFTHQIFMNRKISTSQRPYVIYITEPLNIWMFLAIELHQKMPILEMLPANHKNTSPCTIHPNLFWTSGLWDLQDHFSVGLKVLEVSCLRCILSGTLRRLQDLRIQRLQQARCTLGGQNSHKAYPHPLKDPVDIQSYPGSERPLHRIIWDAINSMARRSWGLLS